MWPHHPRNQVLLEAARTASSASSASRTARSRSPLGPAERPPARRARRRRAVRRGHLLPRSRRCCSRLASRSPSPPRRCATSTASTCRCPVGSISARASCATCEVSFESVYGRSFVLAGTKGQIGIPDWFAPGPVDDSTVDVLRLDESVHAIPGCGRRRVRRDARPVRRRRAARCDAALGSRREPPAGPVDRGVAPGRVLTSGPTTSGGRAMTDPRRTSRLQFDEVANSAADAVRRLRRVVAV